MLLLLRAGRGDKQTVHAVRCGADVGGSGRGLVLGLIGDDGAACCVHGGGVNRRHLTVGRGSTCRRRWLWMLLFGWSTAGRQSVVFWWRRPFLVVERPGLETGGGKAVGVCACVSLASGLSVHALKYWANARDISNLS